MPIAVVTGAAGGIGAALAERLAPSHDRLVLVDIDRPALDRRARRLGAILVELA